MIIARTRRESIALRAAEALALQLSFHIPEADWCALLRIALAQAEENTVPAPRPVRVCLKIGVRGIPPEDL